MLRIRTSLRVPIRSTGEIVTRKWRPMSHHRSVGEHKSTTLRKTQPVRAHQALFHSALLVASRIVAVNANLVTSICKMSISSLKIFQSRTSSRLVIWYHLSVATMETCQSTRGPSTRSISQTQVSSNPNRWKKKSRKVQLMSLMRINNKNRTKKIEFKINEFT